MGAVFVGGLWLGPGYSVNSLFIVVDPAGDVGARQRGHAYRLAAVATLLLPVNTIVVGMAAPIRAVIFSRSMLAITFWLTAFVVTRYRETAAARVEAERALRRTEAALREQTALAQLGQMAAVVAHEVRNPLAGIRGAVQVIGRRLPATGPDQAVVREVVTSIDTLNDIVQDLLLFARPRPPRLSRVPVAGLLTDTVALLRDDPKFREIAMQIDGSDVSVQADAAQLKLVLRNLILNSAQAVDGRGEMRLGTRRRRLDGAACARQRPGHPARSARSGVRAVLHDETSGHGPWPADRAPNHRRPRRHLDPRVPRHRRHDRGRRASARRFRRRGGGVVVDRARRARRARPRGRGPSLRVWKRTT